MDLQILSDELYEDSNAELRYVEWKPELFVIGLSYERAAGHPDTRQSIEIDCPSAIRWHVSPSVIEGVRWVTAHPLLATFREPHELLHHDGEPASRAELQVAIERAKWDYFGPFWSDAELWISGPVQGARSGLITSGPASWIHALEKAIAGQIPTYRTIAQTVFRDARTARGPAGALLLGRWFVLCDEPRVRVVGGAGG